MIKKFKSGRDELSWWQIVSFPLLLLKPTIVGLMEQTTDNCYVLQNCLLRVICLLLFSNSI